MARFFVSGLSPLPGREEVTGLNYFAVYVKDHLDGTRVTVGEMLSRAEAVKLARVISEYGACGVYIIESEYAGSFGRERRKKRELFDM